MASPATRTISIQPGGLTLQPRGYDVLVGSGLLPQLGSSISRNFTGARALIIQDESVPSSFAEAITRDLAQAHIDSMTLLWNPDESAKTLSGASRFLEHLALHRFDRRTVIIALGGGITGDVAGFAAAIFQRGVAWVNCPCTLLAMVDSAIGGKTGVNLLTAGGHLLKNLAGAVHHPSLVVADIETLASLPDRPFRSGIAECIKHGMIGADWDDPGLMEWTLARQASILGREAETLCDLIARNIALKARVVAADERELAESAGGGRMALNLGHTFAHALETLANLSWENHQGLQHGEAVALGLVAACRCAQRLGLVTSAIGDEVQAGVAAFGLPTAVRGLPDDQVLLERMSHDKKARSGVLRLVLPVAAGRVQVVTDPPAEAVRAGLAAIRA